jgi:hypothetical protein
LPEFRLSIVSGNPIQVTGKVLYKPALPEACFFFGRFACPEISVQKKKPKINKAE